MQTSGFMTTLPQNSVMITLTPKGVTPAQPSNSEPVATPIAASASSPSTTSTTAATQSTARPAAHASAAAGVSSAASSASIAETMAAIYSTTVGGVQYSGSVEQSGNEYSVSIPNLPGAMASGLSILSAENNLNIRIDEIV